MEKKLYILLIIIWKNFFITKIVNCFVSWTWTQLINVRLSLSEKKTRINSFVFFDNLFVVAVWKHSTRIVFLNQTYTVFILFSSKKNRTNEYIIVDHTVTTEMLTTSTALSLESQCCGFRNECSKIFIHIHSFRIHSMWRIVVSIQSLYVWRFFLISAFFRNFPPFYFFGTTSKSNQRLYFKLHSVFFFIG